MNTKKLVKLIVVLCTLWTSQVHAQSFDDMYNSKIKHLDQVSSLDALKYYNKNEKDLLIQAIDDGRQWLEPKIKAKMEKVQANALITEAQTQSIAIKYDEYKDLKTKLEDYIAESPAFAFGTGYTKSQWSRMHRAAKSLLEYERGFYLYLNGLQKDMDTKASEIAAAKSKKEKEEVESKKREDATRDEDITPKEDINIAKDRETEIYKYSTFGLLFGIGMWLFFRYKDNV